MSDGDGASHWCELWWMVITYLVCTDAIEEQLSGCDVTCNEALEGRLVVRHIARNRWWDVVCRGMAGMI